MGLPGHNIEGIWLEKGQCLAVTVQRVFGRVALTSKLEATVHEGCGLDVTRSLISIPRITTNPSIHENVAPSQKKKKIHAIRYFQVSQNTLLCSHANFDR